jgi:DNA-binding MarR family transcriptional regulator
MENRTVNQFIQVMQRMQKNSLNFKHDIGMPHSEYALMQLIDCHAQKSDGLTVTALSELIQISKPAVSQIINVLEDKGYVERITTKKDRRIVYVKLTGQGEEALSGAREIASKRLMRVLDKMGEDDAQTFIQLFDKFSIILSDISNE